MKIFRWILSIIITLYVRIWIINNSFKSKKIKTKTSIFIFVLSLILVSFLYFYKDILGLIGLKNLYFSDNLTWSTICLFIFYCLSFLILITIWLKNTKDQKNRKFIIVAILLFIWIWIGWIITGINTLIIYYLISCYAEEILKFSVWENTFLNTNKSNQYNPTDLILFAIISALGFSVVENIFYIIVLNIGEWWNLFTSIGRWIFTTLLHIVTTGLIAFFIIKKEKKSLKYWLKCLIWIICWFALHGCYNLCLAYWYKFFTILILVICYFILSFLLFNTDSIYQKE
jgi:RsiW-degrading membrane proteinase PrsW (M82 family)